MDALINVIEFAKDMGNPWADDALKQLNKAMKTNFQFKENVWSGDVYYKVDDVVVPQNDIVTLIPVNG